MLTNIIIAGILIIPWVVIPFANFADQFRLPKESFFDLICMGIIVVGFLKGIKFTYRNKYLAWLVGWIFISIILTWYIPYTNTYNFQQGIAYFTINYILHFFLVIFASYIVLCNLDEVDLKKIAKVICWSAVIVSVFGIMQVCGLDPTKKIFRYDAEQLQYHSKFTAFMGQPTVVGNFLALSIPYFFNYLKEHKYKLGLLFVIVGIILTRSMVSIVALFAGILLWTFLNYRHNKRVILGLGMIISLICIIGFQNFTHTRVLQLLNGRDSIWKASFDIFKNNTFFGQGFGVLKTFEIKIQRELLTFAHCDYLDRAIEIGLAGLFLMILVIINSFRNFNYSVGNKLGFTYLVSFVVFLIIMVGSFPMEIAQNALLGLIAFWGVEKL